MKNYIGRQSIYNRLRQKVAYECLFRSCTEINACPNKLSEDSKISSSLLAKCNCLGFDRVLENKVGFFNVTEDILEHIDDYNIPEGSVLELIEYADLTDRLSQTIKIVKEKGYKIALDDFLYCHQKSPFIKTADVIKIDYIDCSRAEIDYMVHELRKSAKVLLAEKVETHEDYQHALGLGFDLFQGYYFDKPEILCD